MYASELQTLTIYNYLCNIFAWAEPYSTNLLFRVMKTLQSLILLLIHHYQLIIKPLHM